MSINMEAFELTKERDWIYQMTQSEGITK